MQRRLGLWLSLLLLLLPCATQGQQPARAVLLNVGGVIGPATSDYLHRSLNKAASSGVDLVIVQIDTPGGLDLSMRDMIQDILASPVPVAVYVAPSGARAASAGTYILYSSHYAAMAPGTNIGAATPVQVATPLSPSKGGPADKVEDPPPQGGDAMTKKIVNDAVAYIQSLAQMRGRNMAWAEKAVRDGVSLGAEEALSLGVIDMIAKDVDHLLAQIHMRPVVVAGEEISVDTQGMTVEYVEPDWRSRLLAVITDPSIAYVLMLLGIYGLIYEFANPGMVLPGVVGAIALLLAMFAFQVLPINYAGLGLIILGIAFMVGEAVLPSFGALGIGGVIAFIIGSIILLETDVPGYGVSLALIVVLAVLSVFFIVFVVQMALKARRQRVVSGQEDMRGSIGVVIADFETQGYILVHGERWRARSRQAMRKGQRARVIALDGLTVSVEPAE